jgi:hypothetical protein
MANPCVDLGSKYKFGHLMRVETYPNGGGKVLHLWQDEIAHLPEPEMEELAREFVKVKCPSLFYRARFSKQNAFPELANPDLK